MFYDRKIKYLDVYERGEKVQNAGFVRLEAREEKVNLQIRVEKLRYTDSGKLQIVLSGGNKEAVLGEIQLEKGRGMWEGQGLAGSDMGNGISYKSLENIRIRLPGERCLQCVVSRGEERMEAMASEGVEQERREREGLGEAIAFKEAKQETRERKVLGEAIAFKEAKQEAREREVLGEAVAFKESEQEACEREGLGETMAFKEAEQEACEREGLGEAVAFKEAKQEKRESEDLSAAVVIEGITQEERATETSAGEPKQLKKIAGAIQTKSEQREKHISQEPIKSQGERTHQATKWQQLWEIYPHMKPFGDEREYLRLNPEDFVILTRECYPLIANSFLLHGYFNYDHLILTREKRPEGEHFYIGVPGNYYDKEKQVAVLFGFESFEGKVEPAKNGDFGYYMITVEI